VPRRGSQEPEVAACRDLRPVAGSEVTEIASVEESFTCTLCGARFHNGTAGCASCPLHSDCRLVHCPNCGFGFPARSKWAEWVRRLIGGLRQ
jgi:hypothetical protein